MSKIRSNDLRTIKGATAIKSQFKDITDPTVIGPGIWYSFHSKAFRASNRQLQLEVIAYIRDIINFFPCPVCKGHAEKYLVDHPPEQYVDVMIDNMNLGVFVYSWLFHNSVSARIGKPIMSWDTAFDLYNITEEKKGMCSKACLMAGTEKASSEGSITIPTIKSNRKNFIKSQNLYT